jgi:hypothetical protein
MPKRTASIAASKYSASPKARLAVSAPRMAMDISRSMSRVRLCAE